MSCRTEVKVINDIKYSVTQWPAQKALVMKFRLLKHAGPLLTSIMSSNDEALPDITDMFAHIDPDDLVKCIKDCVMGVAIIDEEGNGERIDDSRFTERFSGDDMGALYSLFIFVLKVNYANLFKGQSVQGLLATLKTAQDQK